MARRNRDLAGLAALGALGMHIARDGKSKPEDRGTKPQAAPAAQDAGFEDTRGMESGIEPLGLRRNELGELSDPIGGYFDRPRQRPVVRPDKAASATSGKAPAATRSMAPADYKNPQRGPSFEDISAFNRSQLSAGNTSKPRDSVVRAGSSAANQPQREAILGGKELSPEEFGLLYRDRNRRLEQQQALERVTPEEYLVGGPGLKGLHTAAKALANRGSKPLKELVQIPAESRAALPAPQARLTGPSKGEVTASQRAAREAERRAETARENAARYNTEGPIGGEGFIMRKKGGAVKAKKMASGGMTSASKRADGIASRGKTKCKMY